jgi:hypothetical protein
MECSASNARQVSRVRFVWPEFDASGEGIGRRAMGIKPWMSDELARARKIRQDYQRRMAEFVEIELDLGMTFGQAALQTEEKDKRSRNLKNAERAFRSAERAFAKLTGDRESAIPGIEEKFDRLRGMIRTLTQ